MANETNFQIGDVVQLKSGGALMTVFLVEQATVRVFHANTQGIPAVLPGSLPKAVLKKVDSNSQSPNPEAGGAI